MADPHVIIDRVRAYGANIVVDDGRLRIVNPERLPENARQVIVDNRASISAALQVGDEAAFEERAAIIEFDGKAPREWAEQFARILIARRPDGISDLDWSWFITTCGRMIDAAPERKAA